MCAVASVNKTRATQNPAQITHRATRAMRVSGTPATDASSESSPSNSRRLFSRPKSKLRY